MFLFFSTEVFGKLSNNTLVLKSASTENFMTVIDSQIGISCISHTFLSVHASFYGMGLLRIQSTQQFEELKDFPFLCLTTTCRQI